MTARVVVAHGVVHHVAESTLQQRHVTQREERYVVPVRADARTRIRGIVHGTSSSGAGGGIADHPDGGTTGTAGAGGGASGTGGAGGDASGTGGAGGHGGSGGAGGHGGGAGGSGGSGGSGGK